LNKEQEVTIFRIVQETLSNAAKNAKAEATKNTIKKNANHLLISVRDNGIGFDCQFPI
jgi:signal transduction histidine kinase